LRYVSKADFEAIGKSSPKIHQHVMKVLARRLRDTNSALAASRWLMPRLGIHLGAGIVALIVNAFIGAVVLLLILRLVGGGVGTPAR
jgi:CRP-like cAMP-binding protein